MSDRSGPAGRCTVCGAGDVYAFVEILQVPVHCNLLWTGREHALDAPRGDIELAFCRRCGHIFNVAFAPQLMEYTQAYENSLHFSPRFQEYAKSLATRLIERYDLYSKDVIEIGSGKGEFLGLLSNLGGNRGLGFDPSYVPVPDDAVASDRVTFIQEFYSESHADHQADLIVCRHVLEHAEDPVGFLTTVRRAIGDRLGTAVYFEVPNMATTLRDLAIWDIIYEHCSYFSRPSLEYLFARCGFRDGEITEVFAGQFLSIDALPGPFPDGSLEAGGEDLERISEDVAAFAARYRHKLESWQHRLETLSRLRQRAVVWGAGSKGVTFLNILRAQEQIEYVVDINPRKQDMYIAGSGQQIVPPAFLQDYQPDVVIVMNAVYGGEISRLASDMGLTPELIYA